MKVQRESYKSELVAEYLLALAYARRKVLNVTKVQKLLYMAYGYFLSNKNRMLISESPKAWPFGPVFPVAREKVNYSEIISIEDPKFDIIKEDKEVGEFFTTLIDKYAKYSTSQLSQWSHEENSPWDLTTKKNRFKWNSPIDDKLIKAYFSTINF